MWTLTHFYCSRSIPACWIRKGTITRRFKCWLSALLVFVNSIWMWAPMPDFLLQYCEFSENAAGQWQSCLSFHLCDINQNIQPLTMKCGRSMLLQVFSPRMGKLSAQTWCKLPDLTWWICHLFIRSWTFMTFYHLCYDPELNKNKDSNKKRPVTYEVRRLTTVNINVFI